MLRSSEIDLKSLTITKAHEALVNKEYRAEDLVQAYRDKISAENPELNAYLGVFDSALEEARVVDRKLAAGQEIGLLEGLPMAIKDNILIKGRVASAASKMLENYTASYDATVIEKLKKAGVSFLGRTNMDEFAMGGSTENSAFGPTKNPHDKARVAGGSSGGSASVVGGDLALFALGSDTGGSIRQPSSFCGVVGLKPTYGAVSRYGVMAMASSLDQIGPIAKTVADAEILFNCLKGKDPLDSTSQDSPEKPVGWKQKMKLGVPRSFLSEGLDPEVKKNFDEVARKFVDIGYELVDVDLSLLKYALSVYYVLMPAEVSANLARFDGMRYGSHAEGTNLLGDYEKTRGQFFGPEARRRIMLGTYVLSAGYYDAYYGKATEVRRLIRAAYDKVFEQVDAVITPTAPSPAFLIGEKTDNPLQMYLEDIYTVPVNLAGVPAISVPCGKTEGGLPLGLQITAPHFREDILFDLGKKVENLSKL